MTDASSTTPNPDRVLLILAFDHRNSLERDLYGLTAPPTPAEAARIAADKLLVYQALLEAAAQLPAEAEPGILVDEQYGASVAELAAQSGGAVTLCMPIEASGHPWFQFEYGDAWKDHARFFPTDHAKVLVRDNPGLDQTQREQQATRLAEVSSWAQTNNRRLMVELLVPATDDDLASVGGDRARYDVEVRPSRTVASIEYLQDHDVEPALWKLEGVDHHDDAVAFAATAGRGGRAAHSIVLGRHAPVDQLETWLRVAAPVPGYVGFAIGRSIWWDALDAQLHGRADADAVRAQVANSYLQLAKYYLSARGGGG